jgi:DNA-binding GntR family transcriptional regulator
MSVETLKRKVYNLILEDIIYKKYPVDYILKEKELSEKFGISKAPVREALIELCAEDIVKSIPRAGYRIVQFTEKDISEATELRLMLEEPVLETIINTISPATIQKLRADVEHFKYAKANSTIPLDTWWNDNIHFHVALNALAGNSLLNSTLKLVIRRQWRLIAQLFRREDLADYLVYKPSTHISLLSEIEKKDIGKASDILSEDILSIRYLFTYKHG